MSDSAVTVKLLLDADVPKSLFRGLSRRKPNLDVLRVQHVGLTKADDPEILAFAAAEGRVLVSRDKATMVDFAAERIARGDTMPGLLLVRPEFARRHGRGLKAVIDELVLIVECSDAEEWQGLIEYVPFF